MLQVLTGTKKPSCVIMLQRWTVPEVSKCCDIQTECNCNGISMDFPSSTLNLSIDEMFLCLDFTTAMLKENIVYF